MSWFTWNCTFLQAFLAERFFKLFDTDKGGTLDLQEIMAGLEKMTKGTQHEKLKFLFDVYDADGETYKVTFSNCLHFASSTSQTWQSMFCVCFSFWPCREWQYWLWRTEDSHPLMHGGKFDELEWGASERSDQGPVRWRRPRQKWNHIVRRTGGRTQQISWDQGQSDHGVNTNEMFTFAPSVFLGEMTSACNCRECPTWWREVQAGKGARLLNWLKFKNLTFAWGAKFSAWDRLSTAYVLSRRTRDTSNFGKTTTIRDVTAGFHIEFCTRARRIVCWHGKRLHGQFSSQRKYRYVNNVYKLLGQLLWKFE